MRAFHLGYFPTRDSGKQQTMANIPCRPAEKLPTFDQKLGLKQMETFGSLGIVPLAGSIPGSQLSVILF